MRKQSQQELMTYGVTFGVISVVAVLWFLIPRVENFSWISSRQVDNLLYQRLDGYEQIFRDAPDLAALMTQALTDPEQMTLQQRREYLSHERRFFGGWEAAFEHAVEGHLDRDRFEVWNQWYTDELRRRPEFAWEENRQYFSARFVAHVDGILGSR